MDAYNIIIIGLINVLIFVIIEAIAVYSILMKQLNKIINNIFNSIAGQINENINNDYDGIINIIQRSINNFVNINLPTELPRFVSQAFRLYVIGYFSDQILDEYRLTLNNMITSAGAFVVIIVGILLSILFVYMINMIIYDGKFTLNIRILVMNLVVGLIIISIFIIAVGFGVFMKVSPDTTDIQIKLMTYFRDNLNSRIQ
jgi:hypothetical protein